MLAIIQEKLNNPSPDDPFEPDIAVVRTFFPSFYTLEETLMRHSCLQQLKNDHNKFLATAKEWTKK